VRLNATEEDRDRARSQGLPQEGIGRLNGGSSLHPLLSPGKTVKIARPWHFSLGDVWTFVRVTDRCWSHVLT